MIFIFVQFLRVCWNWQTGTFEGRVLMAYGFKSRHSHQTAEIRTLYQSVAGSDFYYILTILILIVNLNSIKALA